MFRLEYLDPGMVRRGREFAAVAPLLWLAAGGVGERIDVEPGSGWVLAGTYGVLFTGHDRAGFADAVSAACEAGSGPRLVYVVTDSVAEFQETALLPRTVRTVRLYASYLTNFALNTESTA